MHNQAADLMRSAPIALKLKAFFNILSCMPVFPAPCRKCSPTSDKPRFSLVVEVFLTNVCCGICHEHGIS